MEDQGRIICAKCGAALVPDGENKIYRCMYCGVAYGSSVLFDEKAADKAKKSLEEGEFNEADVRYTCVLMRNPQDPVALRGRILCAGKWKDFEGIEASAGFSAVRLKNVRECIEDAVYKADEDDKDYFRKILKFIDWYEKVCEDETRLTPAVEKFKEFVNRQGSLPGIDAYSPGVVDQKRGELEADIKNLQRQRDADKEEMNAARREILNEESLRGYQAL